MELQILLIHSQTKHSPSPLWSTISNYFIFHGLLTVWDQSNVKGNWRCLLRCVFYHFFLIYSAADGDNSAPYCVLYSTATLNRFLQ